MPKRQWQDTSQPGLRGFETTIGTRFKVSLSEHRRGDYRGVTMFILDQDSLPNREHHNSESDGTDCLYLVGSEVEELRRLLNWSAKETP